MGCCFSFQPPTMRAASDMLQTIAQQSMVSGMNAHQFSSQMHPMMDQRSVTCVVIVTYSELERKREECCTISLFTKILMPLANAGE